MKTSELELGVYETYQDLYGRKATHEELIREISRFSLESVIEVCATVVTGVQLWDRMDPPYDIYQDLVRLFFPLQLARRFIVNFWSRAPRREIFHRRQILLITKTAIEHCGNRGVNLRSNSEHFGSILLKANDQFHYGLIGPGAAGTSTKEDLAKIIAEFSAVSEFSKPNIPNQTVRNHLLLTSFTQRLKSHVDFVDAAALFEEETKLTFEEWEALLFGTHARFNRPLATEVRHRPDALALTMNNFSGVAVAMHKLDAYLDQVSGPPATLRRHIASRDFGPNDFTVFRQFPMVEQWHRVGTTNQCVNFQLMDNHLLLEKQLAGPYWIAFKKNPRRFPPFWGHVFEEYMNALLSNACLGTAARFVSDVRDISNPSAQICDGLIIHGDLLAILEYKASIFTASAKYSGNHNVLKEGRRSARGRHNDLVP